MIKRCKGDNHDKVKDKSMGQLVVVKEEIGGKMVANNKGQHGQARKRVRKKKRKIGDKRGRRCHLNLEET